MFEPLSKALDLASANPNAAIRLLLAAALLCLAAAPIVALTVVGNVVRALIRRDAKGR